ncbi:uncharacterized protein LOC120637805 [Pararge aegeria]|uniref:uncharacterized protein LOC120637805 n=1 Tax=Pararge aegeria TaxID=116150 RepID=UPI0019D305B2|nr:uncharacterized protein LOC120637805 [Pararge aegeria]
MECPCRWANLYLLVYLSLNVANVFGQNILLEKKPPEIAAQTVAGNSKMEVIQNPGPSKAQLINALFSYAAAKGLLPKTTQIIQSTSRETPQITKSQNAPIMFNVGPLQPQISSNCENRLIVTSSPTVSLNPISNQVSPPTTTSCAPSMKIQPTLRAEPVSWTSSSQKCQVGSLENSAMFPPIRTVWQTPQPQQPVSINSYTNNQPVVFNEAIYPNLQTNPQTCALPKINTEYLTFENLCNTNYRTLPEESIVVTSDDKPVIPINLEINIPSLNDYYPRLTVVTEAPANPETCSNFSPYAPPPPQPIIIKRSRSCLRKLLPIILLTLIDNGGGYGCPCNCDAEDPIPIPYPIPIPMNNPIIYSGNRAPYSSRARE